MKSALRRRVTPSVPFILHVEDESGTQDVSFQLSYDFNAFALIEEALGTHPRYNRPWSMFTDVAEILDNPSVTNSSILLWAALQENHREDFEGYKGLAYVRNVLTIETAKEALTKCSEAFVKQLSAEKQESLKAIQKAREEGKQAPPLVPSPAATA